MTTASTIAPVGAAKLFVFFVTKRDTAIAAISCGNVYISFVNKFHTGILKKKAPTSGA